MTELLKKKITSILPSVSANIVLIIFFLIVVVPFAWLIMISFKTNTEILTGSMVDLPKKLHWEHYVKAWQEGNLSIFLRNSGIVTTTVVVGVILTASLAAYSLTVYNFYGNKTIFLTVLVIMMFPVQLFLVSLFVILKAMNILDTYFALILPYIALQMPLSILVFTGFFRDLPLKELREAACLDGCSEFQIFWHVVFPLARPAISALAVFNFIWSWNEFLFALVFIHEKKFMTLPAGIYKFASRFRMDYGIMTSGFVISLVPVIIIFAVLYNHIIKGVVMGGIKG